MNCSVTTERIVYGKAKVDSRFYVAPCKPMIDKIDRVLAPASMASQHEELDFIINYDIKYRMGRKGDRP